MTTAERRCGAVLQVLMDASLLPLITTFQDGLAGRVYAFANELEDDDKARVPRTKWPNVVHEAIVQARVDVLQNL
ncbi:TPA: hypothetical protein N0F65_007913 [Lagenidium giganteum]|uniref:Uncharacterized protein n=1 Tax=Lagenidium giganteum TaxID=4803 RepID=A0AAV2Z4F8_9STRA|nr:TPA: hypothetical protein N0F65_007913 [Lagenidium giganteum]